MPETPPRYINYLTIRQRSKAVPYGGDGVPRADGAANYGFMDLKRHPERISAVPELAGDDALTSLVKAFITQDVGLFSIGCLSANVTEGEGQFRRTGYIEFAWDSPLVVQNAASYFPLFFHFDCFLEKQQKPLWTKFDWELEGATFFNVPDQVTGFTCAITINTASFSTPELARGCWDTSLGLLEQFLSGTPQQPGPRMFLMDFSRPPA